MGSLLSWDDFCFLQVRNAVETIQAWLPLSKQMLYGTEQRGLESGEPKSEGHVLGPFGLTLQTQNFALLRVVQA